MEEPVKTFIYKPEPACMFPYTSLPNWRAQKYNDNTLRFNPGENITIMFEVPPSIIVLPVERVKAADIQYSGESGKNPLGVSFKRIFLKGWEKHGYQFDSGKQKIFVLNVEDYPEHGLPGEQITTMVRNGFEFIDRENLKAHQARALIEDSPHKALLALAEQAKKSRIELNLDNQAERWVVAIKAQIGGPVFHIAKKDLAVTIHKGAGIPAELREKIIAAANVEALARKFDLTLYDVSITDDKTIVDGKLDPKYVVIYMDKTAPKVGLGNRGKIPGLEVWIDKSKITVIKAYYIK